MKVALAVGRNVTTAGPGVRRDDTSRHRTEACDEDPSQTSAIEGPARLAEREARRYNPRPVAFTVGVSNDEQA